MKTNFNNDLAPALIELNRMNEELQAENERLKAENERLKDEREEANSWDDAWKMAERITHLDKCLVKARKKNAKLKCLALHLFEKVAKNEASEWSEFCDDQFPHSGIHKCKRRKEQWLRIVKKCGDEYRKAKAELKEGK